MLSKFNGLQMRLNFRQPVEPSAKQGKFRDRRNFPTELSTKTVDSFSLELDTLRLQTRPRIDPAHEPLRSA